MKTSSIALACLLGICAGCVEHDVVYRDRPAPQPVVNVPPPENAEVVVNEAPPPPPRNEVIVATPGPEYVWVRGSWEWHDRWVWAPGRWILPPRPHAVWVEGRWIPRRGRYVWVRGYWR